MSNPIAHDLEAKWRSADVKIAEKRDFSSFHLDDRILAGLSKAGYKIPSPVQLQAIPLCLSGKDVFFQGKVGTGKTLVFSILALAKVLEAEDLQVMILATTREGAKQICDTINAIGSEIEDLNCEYFIGGVQLAYDIPKTHECKIAVGTPGRIWHLISEEILNINTIRLFVVDDFDELLDSESNNNMLCEKIFEKIPEGGQKVFASVTCTDELMEFADLWLKKPYQTCYSDKDLPPLSGMTHYYRLVSLDFLPALSYRRKLEVLKKILFKVKYSQCVIFCNCLARVEVVYADVRNWGLSVEFMNKAKDQVGRLQALELLKKNKCKVFISTDMVSRGVDAKNVNMVINFDMPPDGRIYLRRCGRAGRYGARSTSITFISESEKDLLIDMQNEENFESHVLPEPIPEDMNCDEHPSKVASVTCELPFLSSSDSEELTSNSESEFTEDCEGTAKVKTRQDTGSKCRSSEEIDVFPGSILKRFSKMHFQGEEMRYKKVTSQVTRGKKSQSKSRERKVRFSGVETTSSESDTNGPCRPPANHSDRKCKIQSKCGKYPDSYDNNSRTSYFNVPGNSFQGGKIFAGGHCSCCNFKPCCPFPYYSSQANNYQPSYFTSYLPK